MNNGIGDKLATVIQWVTTFLGGYVIGFSQSWKLTLVILAVAPLLFVNAIFVVRVRVSQQAARPEGLLTSFYRVFCS